jgi:uncharacterized protein (DUF302 family)
MTPHRGAIQFIKEETMLKVIGGFLLGAAVALLAVWNLAGGMVFNERTSPFTVEETVARIQQNIQASGNGWSLSGLRNPIKPLQADGGDALPVLMIEACSTKYSGPILKDDKIRYLSILMPCKISVYKKSDGKVYIGTMNAGLIGSLFGSMVGDIMKNVVADQQKFLEMDASKPTPPLILPKTAGEGGGAGGGAAGGC